MFTQTFLMTTRAKNAAAFGSATEQVRRHYDDLLAAHYSWMSGMTVADKAVEQATLLAGFGLGDREGGIAVDLGCGPGYQSVALAKLGYDKVIAIDTSRGLLAELELAANDDRIETVRCSNRVQQAPSSAWATRSRTSKPRPMYQRYTATPTTR
jgi:SAM-dependent methyltransferase